MRGIIYTYRGTRCFLGFWQANRQSGKLGGPKVMKFFHRHRKALSMQCYTHIGVGQIKSIVYRPTQEFHQLFEVLFSVAEVIYN